MLKVGDKAPDFSLPDQNEKIHCLSDYLGEYVLLYFYPKDDTPGCTTEACSVRDNLADFNKLNCKVFGISTDNVSSHKKFATKHELSFPLLADEHKKVVKQYEVLAEKSFFGRKLTGVQRSSYLISPEGKIIKIYEKVEPSKHIAEVLLDLNNFDT